LGAAVGVAFAAACASSSDPPKTVDAEALVVTSTAATSASAGPPPDPARVARMKAIASAYTSYSKVVPELQVAPALCKAPIPPKPPSTLFHSASSDEWTHGKKLYYLFASDAEAYTRDGGHEGTKQPDNQVLVKEAYVAEASEWDPKDPEMIGEGSKFWKKGARASLFVMARNASGDAREGKWEFGTVAPNGDVAVEGTATAACHDCHDRKPDGLFGLKKEL
jgi:hypothetical protein